MTDPTFKTRAELEAWAAGQARLVAFGSRSVQLDALAEIRRVTLAHSHLLADKEPK